MMSYISTSPITRHSFKLERINATSSPANVLGNIASTNVNSLLELLKKRPTVAT
jgi:hypothetical protein